MLVILVLQLLEPGPQVVGDPHYLLSLGVDLHLHVVVALLQLLQGQGGGVGVAGGGGEVGFTH